MSKPSVIAFTVSCSKAEEGAGIDTGRTRPSTIPYFLWISFKFPDQEPVQIRVPVLGKDETPEGEPGDNNQTLGDKIQAGVDQAQKDGKITKKQWFYSVNVESKETPDPGGGPGGQDYFCRIVLDGVESIDGGTDCAKIRIGGLTGTVGGVAVGIGAEPPKAKRVELPLPPNPGGMVEDKKGRPCECPPQYGDWEPKPKKKTLPDVESEDDALEDAAKEPKGKPWRNHSN